MIAKIKTKYSINSENIFISGILAGAVMSGAMAANYPDLIAGAGLSAGIPYGRANNLGEAYNCMGGLKEKTPAGRGNKVRNSFGHTGSWPIISIWQGSHDFAVKPVNTRELVKQWTYVHGMDIRPTGSEQANGHDHYTYQDESGKPVVELFVIQVMGHGQPITIGSRPDQCGQAAKYIIDADICSAFHMGKFFKLDQ